MILIAIDDGHGMETPGKRTPTFSDGSVMRENEFNNAVAEYLDAELTNCGFKTLRVAPSHIDTPLEARVSLANKAGVDCYISIHANAFGSTWNEASGIESWIFEGAKRGGDTYNLAEALQTNLVTATGRINRGVKTSGALYVLNATNMPAVLLECGFMTNLEEAKLLLCDSYRKTCAMAICDGICKHFGYTKKCPSWKIEGEAFLRQSGLTSSHHDPLEVIDYGALGVILKRSGVKAI